MSNYYLQLILLEGCPYSENAYKTVNNYNIKNESIWINDDNKEIYKEKYPTFPQIYLKKDNSNGSLLLGGNSDLQDFIKLFYKKKYNEKYINEFMTKNSWSKKATLRMIELINSI